MIILILWGFEFTASTAEQQILPDTPMNRSEKSIYRLFKTYLPRIRAAP